MEYNIDDIKNIFTSESILDSIKDGIYVTDKDRKIVYWNKGAENITGWRKDEVVGQSCFDEILCHADKEDRKLCGTDTCPLHRAIITGQPSESPIVVYAQSKDKSRIPVQVNVSPIKNRDGEIIGGVETFRDMSDAAKDLERARKIQRKSLKWHIAEDAPIKASVLYLPHDIIGGDYYAVEQLSYSQYIFLLGDVMGHGVSSALHTMYLRSMFDEYKTLLPDITTFLNTLNQQLHQLMRDNFSFASVVCGLIETDKNRLTVVGGAHPSPFLYRKNNLSVQTIKIAGFALGMVKNANYTPQIFDFNAGDTLFLYTDGAVENFDQNDNELGESGLIKILDLVGYPHKNFLHKEIEDEILKKTNNVSLKDDVTLLEFNWRA
ncbi:MAG: SpoIIE family protein phosphatase [Desulfamplus sp.]|nr:SpoIIE family protein phosphatase [Desulfamplus sp.]MBF0389777.1 SpoIIE family protein phosphatase [Desulfamplus sp.]